MDNDYGLDLDEVKRVIASADVMMLRFVIVPQRLLMDGRSNELDGPMLKIVPRVSGARERFRELRRLRPRFALPDRITAVAWPRKIASLESTGVWTAVEERLAASGFPDATVAGSRHSGRAEAARVRRDAKRDPRRGLPHLLGAPLLVNPPA